MPPPEVEREFEAALDAYMTEWEATLRSHVIGEPARKHADPPNEIAIAGADGRRAEQLLAHAKSDGTRVLASVTRRALERLTDMGGLRRVMAATRLFTPHERKRLAASLTATTATAHLLGAARIRRRADQVARRHAGLGAFADPVQRLSDLPTDLQCFDDSTLAPLAPQEAVAYFRSLVPGLSVNPETFADEANRQGFSLAVTTDETLLAKIHEIIARRLETGEDVVGGPAEIQALLEEAGVAPENPQYADMVFRTNMMDGYNEGSWRELRQVADVFPVWRYINPDDSRSRPHHAARNGKYWSSHVNFADVRGRDAADACNDRCSFAPVDRFEWEELQAAGERVETVW